MERSGTTKGNEREESRVVAAFDRNHANRRLHVGVGHADHAERGLFDRRLEPFGDLADRRQGRVPVEPHPSAKECIRNQSPQHDIRIGDSRFGPAASIGRRSGIGSGRLRSNPQRSAAVEPGDAPASSAHRVNVNHGEFARMPADTPIGRLRHTTVDQRHIG